jgi:glycosyltransferase involved in cell wall biosynthesis
MHETLESLRARRPLRLVLIANRHEFNDGQGRVNYEVALAALNSGMKVTLLTAYCADEIANHPNAQVFYAGKERLPTQLLKNLAFAYDSARWLRYHQGEWDLVQANGFVTWEKCDIVTAHFVHTAWAHNPYFPFSRSLHPRALYQRLFTVLNASWERSTFQNARHVIAVSRTVANEVRALGVPPERIEVICNGVDVDEFCPGPPNRDAFNLPERVPLALFVGDIRSPRKNIDTLLKAMQQVPELHLAVAGDTKRSSGPALASELGLEGRVHFLGKTPNVAALMRSADLFAFPSRYEPFGLVVLEAMASGLPVVASRSTGCVSTFGDVIELVDDPNDVKALASSISGLLNSRERRERMSRLGREKVLAFSWAETTRAYLRTYEIIANKLARQSKINE